jgi:hypothetical protein
MAPAQPFQSQPDPFPQAVFADRLGHEIGAGRIKPAMVADKRGEDYLVDSDGRQNRAFHERIQFFPLIACNAEKYWARMSRQPASRMSFLAIRRISKGYINKSLFLLNNSLALRRILLR